MVQGSEYAIQEEQRAALAQINDSSPAPGELSVETRAAITAAILEDLIPEQEFGKGHAGLYSGIERGTDLFPVGIYSDAKLITICRLVALGLSETSAAKACGVAPQTLRNWKALRPDVEQEIGRAKYMAVGAVAVILRLLMRSKNEAVALKAVEFFLKTRSKEFREKWDGEIEVDFAKLQEKIMRDLYGHGADEDAGALEGAPESDSMRHAAIEACVSMEAAARPQKELVAI